jgi:hypothetical protein
MGWNMANAMERVVQKIPKLHWTISFKFISMNVSDVIIINDQSWLSVHVYVMKK